MSTEGQDLKSKLEARDGTIEALEAENAQLKEENMRLTRAVTRFLPSTPSMHNSTVGSAGVGEASCLPQPLIWRMSRVRRFCRSAFRRGFNRRPVEESGLAWAEDADTWEDPEQREPDEPVPDDPYKAPHWSEAVVADLLKRREFDCRCPPCTAARDEADSGDLATRTRLRRQLFFKLAHGHIRLTLKSQLTYLKKSLALAQVSLWTALRKEYPADQVRHYPAGPASVCFGRTELERTIGSLEQPSHIAGLCKHTPYSIVAACVGVIPLRNVIAHPGWVHLEDIDNYMLRAQALTIKLQDERRAMKIRKMRDDLQRHAIREYDKMLSYKPTLLDQDSPDHAFPLHHQEFFNDILTYQGLWPGQTAEGRYGEKAVRVAKAWKSRHPNEHYDDPEHKAQARRREANVENVKTRRRVSMSVVDRGYNEYRYDHCCEDDPESRARRRRENADDTVTRTQWRHGSTMAVDFDDSTVPDRSLQALCLEAEPFVRRLELEENWELKHRPPQTSTPRVEQNPGGSL